MLGLFNAETYLESSRKQDMSLTFSCTCISSLAFVLYF